MQVTRPNPAVHRQLRPRHNMASYLQGGCAAMLYRVLLIEDSEGEALLVKQSFREAGFAEPIHWINNGERAIAYLSGDGPYADREAHPLPDIILLDLNMPNVDGYQFLHWIRRQPLLSKTFVVILTGEINPKRIQMAYQLGANSFLSKSAGPEEYRNFVEFLRGFALVSNLLPRHEENMENAVPLKPVDHGDSEKIFKAG